jgi:cytochrome b561/polyisoprenoid-binding protein YceI
MMSNTAASYGSVARTLHWLTALLILALIPTGIIANGLPADTSDDLLAKAQLFSVHKTLGVALFAVAVLRIVWAMSQPRPADLHPERRWEMLAARTVHWLLYGSLVLVPLTGWIAHAATTGFAPILWPLGQGLPFVPKSAAVYETAAALHIIFERVLVISLVLDVAAALKHRVWDCDATLRRMLSGRVPVTPGSTAPARQGSRLAPLGMALVLWAAALGIGAGLGLFTQSPPVAAVAPDSVETADSGQAIGNWTVEAGTLSLAIRQLGQAVQGSFATWTADITFDPDPEAMDPGHVRVAIDIASLTLGQVTTQALGADFFDATGHPQAVFEAELARSVDHMFHADGHLTLKGMRVPVRLAFRMRLDGDTAEVSGGTTLDRRDFGIGMQMGDEATLGFTVEVAVDLVARRTGD